MSLIPKLHGKALLKQQKEAVIKIIKWKRSMGERWGCFFCGEPEAWEFANSQRGNKDISSRTPILPLSVFTLPVVQSAGKKNTFVVRSPTRGGRRRRLLVPKEGCRRRRKMKKKRVERFD